MSVFNSGLMALSLVGLCLVFSSGCGQDADTRGQRLAVSGTVVLDGEPLSQGQIRIISDQGQGQLRAMATIRDGQFRFDRQHGPLAGTGRVEIYPPEMELEQYELARAGKDHGYTPAFIPAKYNTESVLTANISPETAGEPLSFELSSATE